MLTFIDHIAFLRDGAPPGSEWKKIGKLFHNKSTTETKILFFAMRAGLCIATPRDDSPFLQGEIVVPVYMGEEARDEFKIFVGFISTGQNERGLNIYNIKIEAIPCVPFQRGGGVWCSIVDESHSGYNDTTKYNPFRTP